MKLTPGVNFSNVLQAAFDLEDLKSKKDSDDFDCLFYTFGIFVHKSRAKTCW